MNNVSFPGLGLSFELNPVAFTIFGLEIKWYGVIITCGIILAFLYFYFRATRCEKINPDYLYDLALFTVPIGIVGARFVYVITNLDYYGSDFLKMLDIRQGGLAIYGGIIFGAITVITFCKIKKINTLKVLDALGPGVMIGQIIGRWGNFVNAEAYGYSEGVENWFLRMQIGEQCYHPTFLYESVWNLIGFILINIFIYKKAKKFDGIVFAHYIGWYGLGRTFIELLRTDSLYIGPLKFSVVVGSLSFIGAFIAILLLKKHQKKIQAEAQNLGYTPKFQTEQTEEVSDNSTETPDNTVTEENTVSEETTLKEETSLSTEKPADQNPTDAEPSDDQPQQ